MATYAVGDIQGCFDSFRRLLDLVRFDSKRDRLWLVGDLVNRGPHSLETLRFVKGLGEAAITVLGNHDLHLVMLAEGHSKKRDDDTLDAILAAYVERDLSARDIVAQGFDAATVKRVIRMVDLAEYKRRQAPPGPRITPRNFGKDRRYPITSKYRPEGDLP